MAVRSIIDIDLNDAKFRDFAKLYDKYDKSLKSAPQAWAGVNREVVKLSNKMSKELIALDRAQERSERLAAASATRWSSMAGSAKSFASSIKEATFSLLKWGSITGVISGLVGAGGIWGIDRLALGVAGARRSALGLGTSIGGASAFSSNFSRLVDPDRFLSGVAGAQLDINQRVGLLGAGLTQDQIGGDTATTAVALLRNLKRIADTTNPALYGQVIQARRLDVSPEELLRMHNTSWQEFEQLNRQSVQMRGQFDLDPDTAKRWQDFTTQMSNAGKAIETVLVKRLVGLEPGLEKLSGAVERFFGTILEKGGPAERWIGKVGDGIEKFAQYIGTDDFEGKVRSFVDGIGAMGAAIARVLAWFGGGPAGSGGSPGSKGIRDRMALAHQRAAHRGDVTNPALEATTRFLFGPDTTDKLFPSNNPGNLRPVGNGYGYMRYDTPEAGIEAMARQLRLYGNRDHLDTIAGIVSKYAPPSENNTAAYIGDVSGRTGFAPGQHINVNDTATMARLIAAMVAHEQKKGHFDKYKDAKVVVEVLNNTGGNATVSVNGLKN